MAAYVSNVYSVSGKICEIRIVFVRVAEPAHSLQNAPAIYDRTRLMLVNARAAAMRPYQALLACVGRQGYDICKRAPAMTLYEVGHLLAKHETPSPCHFLRGHDLSIIHVGALREKLTIQYSLCEALG